MSNVEDHLVSTSWSSWRSFCLKVLSTSEKYWWCRDDAQICKKGKLIHIYNRCTLTPRISERVVATGSRFNTSSNVAGAGVSGSGAKSTASSFAYLSSVMAPRTALQAKFTIWGKHLGSQDLIRLEWLWKIHEVYLICCPTMSNLIFRCRRRRSKWTKNVSLFDALSSVIHPIWQWVSERPKRLLRKYNTLSVMPMRSVIYTKAVVRCFPSWQPGTRWKPIRLDRSFNVSLVPSIVSL